MVTDADAKRMYPEFYPDLTIPAWSNRTGPNGHPIAYITRKAYDKLPEYSLSLPTGTFLWKCWRCDLSRRRKGNPPPNFILMRYEPIQGNSKELYIRRYDVGIIE